MGSARYDAIAASYSERPDDYGVPATAAILELVGPVEGQSVLDIACGHGLLARELARRGGRVVGLDISAKLIAAAVDRQKSEPLGIDYVVADAAGREVLEGKAFDSIVCNFGMTDIDNLEATLSHVAHLLRRGGRFVFGILHPCFPGVDRVSGSWSPDATYYDEGWWLADEELSTLRREVGSNHRTISTYLNAIVAAGLSIDCVREPRPDEAWASERTDAGRYPVYFVVSAVKP